MAVILSGLQILLENPNQKGVFSSPPARSLKLLDSKGAIHSFFWAIKER